MPMAVCVKPFVLAAIFLVTCQINFGQIAEKDEQEAKPIAVKILEFGKVTDRVVSKNTLDVVNSLDRTLWNSWDPKFGLVIVNYGTDQQIIRRERLITKSLETVRLHHARITFVRGGSCKPFGTVFWQIPREASLPTICEKLN
jgi:hypothetical protein